MGRDESTETSLSPYLSKLGVWAFSIGCSIGWGSFIVTSSSYLRQAGAWGSILGLLLGALIMIVIARNYHYMVNCFPDAGGAYTYAKEVFGHDHGFLTAWFLFLTYIAVFWANVTSLPLFTQYFAGDILKIGFHYTLFDYDIYLGEAALSILAIILTVLACMRSRKWTMRAMVAMSALFTISILAAFIACASRLGSPAFSIDPGFVPNASELSQIALIASISPWAFIGFENVSHSAPEFNFPHTQLFKILLASIVFTTILYIAVMLMSTMVHPPQYANWLEYISDLGNLSGIEALPAFYAAYALLGDGGVALLMLALLALVLTSLIGNVIALSRMAYALAKDDILPGRLAYVNKQGSPQNALLAIGAVSFVVPFIGRTAIGWIVDVTTIGAIIIYAIVSASTFKIARARGERTERTTGVLGAAIMIAFGCYLLISGLISSDVMEPESYFLFAIWGLLGFAAFRILLAHDKKKRFGRSTIVWVGLLSLVMFVGFTWMDQTLMGSERTADSAISSSYDVNTETNETVASNKTMLHEQIQDLQKRRLITMLMAAGLFTLASILLITNFAHVSRWARESDDKLGKTWLVIYTNPITGLPSMMRFLETAPEVAERIRENGGTPALIAFRLMGYKNHIENYGHENGNKILRAIGKELVSAFGRENCAHASDEHFYVIAPLEDVEPKTFNVFEACSAYHESLRLPLKAGVFPCQPDDDIATTGINRARTACDSHSKSWESELLWYDDELGAEVKMRSYVLETVDEAIEHRWIRPYYQAEVDAHTHRICGAEALARWIDPNVGFLSPAQFIPVLEEAGVLHKVDLHMIDCVTADLARKKSQGLPVVPISVNISMDDLAKFDVTHEISKRADEAGVERSLLHIEFTESAAISDAGMLQEAVDELKAAGFEVWMDDFGSGYSSLNSLKNFNFDVVKLDMEFLRDDKNPRTWDVIAGIVLMVQKLGMRTLAEGVETEEQATRLAEAGCDILQGYYFAKPLSLEEIDAKYKDEKTASRK
jgi:EAL domain-containing protein (putative c-di-GMP-specific phosphodiesterase class I)/amino acid transporter|nr:amino acid permease [Denitrobacterium detoxificans]